MRRVQKGKRGKPRKKAEPLAEGIISVDKRGRRDWKSMSDDDLVGYAQRVIDENRLKGRRELADADGGLYNVLLKRNLIDDVGLEDKRGTVRDWKSMSDDELVEYARGILGERGLEKRTELKKSYIRLYQVLRRRKLLGMVGLVSAQEDKRDWASMSDQKVVQFARRLLRTKGLRLREELRKADYGLYYVLYKRGLFNAVFAHVEAQTKREAVRQVVDAMKEFDA